MKIHIQIARFAVLALVCLNTNTCGQVKITSPDETRKNLTVPFDLVVEHSGCGQPLPEITAWLDRGTTKEQDISSAFVFDGSHTWSASSYPLPLGSHTLEVDPQVDWGNPLVCIGGFNTKREFVVHESTCIRGKLYKRSFPESLPEPISNAIVDVTLVDGAEKVASRVTDANGAFCLDGIPVGHFFDVTFTKGEKLTPVIANVDAGVTPHSCANQDCIDICEYRPEYCDAGCFFAEPPEF
jgi:hypothetical protein